jgi:DNA transposition AAA+ family ATPase
MENPTTTDPQVQEKNDTSRNATGDTVRASWPFSLDDIKKALSHNPEQVQDLMVWCFLWCIDDAHPIRRQEFASRISTDDTTIFRILKGTYLHHENRTRLPISPKIISAMEVFKNLEVERHLSGKTVFIETPTARRIFQLCSLALESQSPVFLIGPSHVGKTWALMEYTRRNNHGRTVYVRLAAASGLGGMIKAIAKALGISDNANVADLTARIKRALKGNVLLILDEVHQLMYTYRKESFFACLEVIREFYDASQCGLVLCGTELLFKRVKENRGELEQLIRRGVHKCILPDMPTAGDVKAIVTANGLEMPSRRESITVRLEKSGGGYSELTEQPYEMLHQIAKEQGLKAITERLRYGNKLARKARTTLGWAHVVKAHLLITSDTLNTNDWE